MSVALITGAASGMGRACAERFVAEGWKVAALDRADAAVDGALGIQADVTDPAAAIERAVAELAPRVRVNALAPGWVDTPGNRATGRMEAALASVPLGRAATPEEMADLVWFLAGAPFVTGETLTATGGSAFR